MVWAEALTSKKKSSNLCFVYNFQSNNINPNVLHVLHKLCSVALPSVLDFRGDVVEDGLC